MPLISVITPVYNGEKYLLRTLSSLFSQTMEDWELIVVNDGSTDGTARILTELSDQRINIINQENAGEAQARNKGLSVARGKYIAFLDADDIYLPNALADLSDFLSLHPEFDVVFSDGYICDEDDHHLMRLTEVRPGIHSGNILEALILSPGVITVPVCTMVRRLAVEKYNVSFDRNLVIGPDWDFWIQLALHVKFGYLDRLTCMYRVHHTNITRTSGIKKRQADLLYNRIKILNSDWFDSLSLSTRKQFFYSLLVSHLANQPTQQDAILANSSFLKMPVNDQADLWRQVGVGYLTSGEENDFGFYCLKQALRKNPSDRKNKVLTWWISHKFTRPYTSQLIWLWQEIHQVSIALKSIGKPKSRPVPAALSPIDG